MMVGHLRKQGGPCKTKNGGRYRGEDGSMCGVGALIPDEIYDPYMEGIACTSGTMAIVLGKLGHDPSLCGRVQQIHDTMPVEKWKSAFAKVARDYRLKYEV